MTDIIRAWYGSGPPNEDGLFVVANVGGHYAVGDSLTVKGPIVLCKWGLHASVRPLDMLQYTYGSWVHIVDVSGGVVVGGDKIAGRRRDHLFAFDASTVYRAAARSFALDVTDLWGAPKVVIEWLTTGDESLRAAAWSAVRQKQSDRLSVMLLAEAARLGFVNDKT